jgi:hypothetical protein
MRQLSLLQKAVEYAVNRLDAEANKPQIAGDLAVALAQSRVQQDPIEELCSYIKESIRFCDHGYIHVTCGDCQLRQQ